MKPFTITICVLTVAAQCAFAQPAEFLYSSCGGRAGLVIPDENVAIDAGFEVGSHAGFAFGLKRWGQVDYIPSISWWFGGQRDDQGLGTMVSEVDFNFLDFRYYPPIAKTFTVHPYAGFAPMVAVTVYQREYYADTLQNDTKVVDERTDTGWDLGMNFFGGAEFRFTDTFRMFTEMRGKAGGWGVAKLSIGFSFIKR